MRPRAMTGSDPVMAWRGTAGADLNGAAISVVPGVRRTRTRRTAMTGSDPDRAAVDMDLRTVGVVRLLS